MDGSLYYVHQDLLDSTVAVSDAAGQPLSRSHYLPYGEVYKSEYWDGNQWQEYDPATTPIPETDYLYTGHLLDRNTNLYYYGGGRYYDPVIAHTLQPDPFGGVPQLPQTLNRYAAPGGVPAGAYGIGISKANIYRGLTSRMLAYETRGHPSYEETHSLHMVEKLAHKGADLIHGYEAFHRFSHGWEMARGGLRLARGSTYAGQMIVYGTHEAKALAKLPTHLTHARAATYPGLIPYTNPLVAAGEVIRSPWTAAALGIVYVVDIYEYQWGSKHDVGLASTEFASAMTVDTTITLGPPAVGALIGTFVAPGPVGTAVGTAAGYGVSILWSLVFREATVSFTDEHVITPSWEAYQHTVEMKMQLMQEDPYAGLMWGSAW